MAEICHRSKKPVYPADKPIRIGGLVFNPNCFTCAATGTKLTLKNAVVYKGEVYHIGHEPKDMPTQVIDSTMQTQMNTPDAKMTKVEFAKSDASHNFGKDAVVIQTAMNAPDASHGQVEFAKSDANHTYGAGAVGVTSAVSAPKVPPTVNNINKMEQRHQGVDKFSGSA